MDRYLQSLIKIDLSKKMVFIGGPRQVGKTTLSQNISREFSRSTYLNWDSRDDRLDILSHIYSADSTLLILDEIHKYPGWKNHLKGLYDTRKNDFSILITGSARLDIYQKGGDSLLGRYFYYRLHPLSIAELLERQCDPGTPFVFIDDVPDTLWADLIEFGGFPEIYYARDRRDMRRWHRDRTQRLIQEDIRDLSTIRDIARIDLLVTLLPARVGSIFSLNSMIEDIQVTHKTLTHWIEILEQTYFCYRIYPYQSTRIRSLKKEPKMYLWDYTGIDDIGIRYENIVANHLLKYIHFLVDVHGMDAELYFLRDREQREVDFCIEIDGVIQCIIEVKSKKQSVSPHLRYFYEKLGHPPAYQLVFERGIDEDHDGIRVMSADRFLSALV